MGTVTAPDQHTPGKYVHYKYCDHCGSFDLKPWVETPNLDRVLRLRKLLIPLSILLLAGFVALTLLPILEDDTIRFYLLGLLIATVLGLVIYRPKKETIGLECNQCQTRYPFGSKFFADHTNNPKQLSMKDVPLPLNKNYQVRGSALKEKA